MKNLIFTKKKIIIKTICILFILGSIGFNLYVGFRQLEQRIYLRGVDDAINSIVIQVRQIGEVRINTDQGQMILVPQTTEQGQPLEIPPAE